MLNNRHIGRYMINDNHISDKCTTAHDMQVTHYCEMKWK